MINKFSKNNDSNKIYDLEERTAQFGEAIIDLCAHIKMGTITTPLVNQLVRLGTSIGANYCEANNASSKKDFRNKIFICKKECQETKHWLRMLIRALPEEKEPINRLWKECQELTMIFQKITTSIDENNHKH